MEGRGLVGHMEGGVEKEGEREEKRETRLVEWRGKRGDGVE